MARGSQVADPNKQDNKIQDKIESWVHPSSPNGPHGAGSPPVVSIQGRLPIKRKRERKKQKEEVAPDGQNTTKTKTRCMFEAAPSHIDSCKRKEGRGGKKTQPNPQKTELLREFRFVPNINKISKIPATRMTEMFMNQQKPISLPDAFIAKQRTPQLKNRKHSQKTKRARFEKKTKSPNWGPNILETRLPTSIK